MSNGAGTGASADMPTGGEARNPAANRREAITPRDNDGTDALLRFLGQLSRFGLAAGMEPLLKPAKPGS